MTGPQLNNNPVEAQAGIPQPIEADAHDAPQVNPDLGNVSKPSAWALAGRVVLGICSLCLSELIIAIVSAVKARSVDKPKLELGGGKNGSGNVAENKIDDFVGEVKEKVADVSLDKLYSDIDALEDYPKELKDAMKKIVAAAPDLESWKYFKEIVSSKLTLGYDVEKDLASSKWNQDTPINLACIRFAHLFNAVDQAHTDLCGNDYVKALHLEDERLQCKKLLTVCALKATPFYLQTVRNFTEEYLEKMYEMVSFANTDVFRDNAEKMQAILEVKKSMKENSPEQQIS